MNVAQHSVLLALALALPSTYSAAESLHPTMDSKHQIIFGGYHQNADATFSAQRDGLPKTEVNLGDLGLKDTDDSWMLEYRYKINDNWQISASAYTFSSSGHKSVGKNFNFDGKEYEAGVGVKTGLDVDTYIADIMYTAYHSDRAHISLGGGLHVLKLAIDIEGNAFVNEQEGSFQKSTEDMLAPLPNLRAQGFYAITSRWAMMATVGWLSAAVDDYDGGFTYLHLRTNYRFTDHFGVGLGYQFLDMDITHDKSDGKTKADIQFDGPTIQLSYSF